MMNKQQCWVFGDNIDTDQIIPSQYLVFSLEEMLPHALETQSGNFAKDVTAGDFIVAGKNFGCGSSREQAPLVLKKLGIKAIIAKSFARIFYRNSINIGLLLIELPNANELSEGDSLNVDAEKGIVKNVTKDKSYTFFPPTGLVKAIIDAGGLLKYIEKNEKID